MTASARPSWPRPKFTPGGGNARLFYKIHGQFQKNMQLTPQKYGGGGIPKGCTMQSYDLMRHANVIRFGLDGEAVRHLRSYGDKLYVEVAEAQQCIVVRGEIADPNNYDYLRDVIGLILTVLDNGGKAVYDPLLQQWWSDDVWRKIALASTGFNPSDHVIIVEEPDDDPTMVWVRTRGMAKFGRPDISVREVSQELLPAIRELCGMLISTLAQGSVLGDQQEIRTERLPGAWQLNFVGKSVETENNNVHFEVRRIS